MRTRGAESKGGRDDASHLVDIVFVADWRHMALVWARAQR